MSDRTPQTTHLTAPQTKALRYLATVRYATPAQIGEAMGAAAIS